MSNTVSKFFRSNWRSVISMLANSGTLYIGASSLRSNIDHGPSVKIFCSILCITMGLFGIFTAVIRARKLIIE